MSRRTLFAVAGWLVAAVVAMLTGLAAVAVIGAGLTGPAGAVRDADEVARAAAVPTPVPQSTGAAVTPPAPTGTPSAAATPTTLTAPATPASRRVLAFPGGTVVAQCVGRDVLLVSWAPAQGYGVADVDRGPDDDAEITFKGAGGKIEVTVRCAGGQPVGSWKLDD